jgi:hypothetical protein
VPDNPAKFLNPPENLVAFLRELTELSHRYQVVITGCRCCGSPGLAQGDLAPELLYYQSPRDGSLQFNSPDQQREAIESYRFDYEEELGGEV